MRTQQGCAIAISALVLCIVLVSAASATVLGGPLVSPVNGHTYYLLSQSNWTDAETMAQSLGGHLATIRSQAENDWVFDTFAWWTGNRRSLWIGFTDQEVEGTWHWISGEPILYTNWDTSWGHPDNYLGEDPIHGEDYAHLENYVGWSTNGQWNDNMERVDYLNQGQVNTFHGIAEVVPEPAVLLLAGIASLLPLIRPPRQRI